MAHLLCFFSPVSCATTSIAKSTLGDVFGALTGWVLTSVQWFLSAAGLVVSSASEPATVITSATPEFNVLLVMAPLLMLVGLLVSTLQSLRHADTASLWRVYLGVAPSCALAIALARPLSSLILTSVNQLSSTAAASMSQHAPSLVMAFSSLSSSTPGFALFLMAIGVVVGSWLLWCELIVRSVVLTLLIVLVPVIVPLSTFPAMRRIGWRLGETFLAVAFSKFLIVITLSLGFDELKGTSATQIITGAVTLVLATFSPFLLFRLIPFLEQSALHHLDGLRQRMTHTAMNAPSSLAGTALRAVTPSAAMPEPPARPEDLGLAMWEASPEFEFPEYTGEKLPPPIGTPTVRGGHVAYSKDDIGPVVGWHFDE
ncbi:MAG: hypothetical protein ACYC19_00430 [Acidimicrobiales bacterium]